MKGSTVDPKEAGACLTCPSKGTNVGKTKGKKATCWIHRSGKSEARAKSCLDKSIIGSGMGRKRRIASYMREELVAPDTSRVDVTLPEKSRN